MSLNEHFNSAGQPKNQLTEAAAYALAEELKLKDVAVSPYLCSMCNYWHIGKSKEN